MARSPGRFEAWHVLLSILYVALGVIIGIRIHIEITNATKSLHIAIQALLVATLTISTWSITYLYLRYKQAKSRKDLARTSIRRIFELLKSTSRTLDNIDVKAATALNGTLDDKLDKALAHEFIQGIRAQVVEVYNDVSMCIEEWRDELAEEFEEIEKRERQLDKLIIDQIVKTRKLHELERAEGENEKEIALLKADLDRLAEKQRTCRSEILSQSRKLVGAPITNTIDVTSAAHSIGKFEPLIKQPVYIRSSEDVEVKNA